MIIAVNFQLKQLERRNLISQLVEHRTGIAVVMGSNPVEALIFFRFLISSCLSWKFTAKIILYFHLHPQYRYESFHTYYTSFHSSHVRFELN